LMLQLPLLLRGPGTARGRVICRDYAWIRKFGRNLAESRCAAKATRRIAKMPEFQIGSRRNRGNPT
jgi:hypothetical protein